MPPRRARVVLADHQVLFRQSLAAHLAGGGHEVVHEVDNGEELESCMIEYTPDIVMLDRYLPKLDSLEYIQVLHALQPQTPVLLLTGYEHEARTIQGEAFLAGAGGCLSKDLPAIAYLGALRRLVDGHLLFPPDVMRRAARPTIPSGPAMRLNELTEREYEVLQLVADGLGNREIATRLSITYNTAMKHVSNIIRKLKVNNRMEAGLFFIRNNPRKP